jgi:hypothetical protein
MDQNVRPDFYEGQYLGAEDLDGVVDYERVQRARHVLGAHTWGIAAGLELRERKLPSGDVEVSILPGIAWDGYSRTVAVLEPAVIRVDKFANFIADTPLEGQLIKVWLRYAETASQPPAPGFEICRPDGLFSRVVERYAIEVGEPSEPAHGSVNIAGRAIEARKARSAFLTGAPDLFDESVPHQAFPLRGNRPSWLIPIGFVRWLKTAGQPGRLIPRNDKGAGGIPPDSDLTRAFRKYIGVVAEEVAAADGLIRLRDRAKDPAPTISHVRTPRMTTDPKRPSENDLVWVEGNLHVLGDTRVSGGKAEFRNTVGETDGVPLALRRVEPNAQGGKDLQVVIGTEAPPTGAHAFAVGPGSIDATTGHLASTLSKRFVVRDNGTVGVGIDAPPQLLTLGGDKKTRLEIARVSATLPWSSTNAAKNGDGSFVINHQSQGSDNPGADFALMRDRRQRMVLLDHDTRVSSQGGDVIVSANLGEAGEAEALRVTQAANVGVNTAAPVAKLQVGGDVALEKITSGAARPLPAGGTMIWNDGTWLRLNQNLNFTAPIFGVHTPKLLTSGSLNVGGVAAWGDPGNNNATFQGNVAIGAFTAPEQLHVQGTMRCTGAAKFDGSIGCGGTVAVGGNQGITGILQTGGPIFCGGNIFAAGIKFFLIPHPVAPERKRLVHASVEGPEAAVFYRGEGRLKKGTATIKLPSYFEALTRPEGRTIQLTPILDGNKPASALAATPVAKGQFTVKAITEGNPSQGFWWEVKAVRADIPELAAEINAADDPQKAVLAELARS